MRSVMCCWADDGPDRFEGSVPLAFSGARNLALGFGNDIDVHFLSGYECLGEDYRDGLRELGYRIHDSNRLLQEHSRRFPQLGRFSGYERKCFLRWLVLASHYQGEAIVHCDGDILFNEDPAVIQELLREMTFVLQGCPALASIVDGAWFNQYEEELGRFSRDVEGYSRQAWEERQGWEASDIGKWAGRRDRLIISHDQDLISHLIHTDRIVQDPPSEVRSRLGSYLLFENPLYMHGYDNDLRLARYERRGSIDYIDDRRVLVWHMQNDFVEYLNRFILRKKLFLRRPSRLEREGGHRSRDAVLRKLLGLSGNRLEVYRYFFQEHDLREVLSDGTWWERGAFS